MGLLSVSFASDNIEANSKLLEEKQLPFNQLLSPKTQAILETLNPVTRPTYDSEGNIIQIWQRHRVYLGTILGENGNLIIVPNFNIHNGLQPHESGDSFLDRIASLPSRKWGLITLPNGHIVVWPHLVAAGRPGPDLPLAALEDNIGHTFRRSAKGGHLHEDTKENRDLLIKVGSDYRNWIGTNKYGQDVFFKCQEDGSQVWVYRIGDKIRNGGVNLKGQHSIFNCKSRLVERYVPKGGFNYSVSSIVQNHITLRHFQNKDRPPPGGNGGPGGGPRGSGGPGVRQFQQLLQQTKLTDSYNTNHRGNPVPAKGGTGGTIGGVACGVDYIQGLFDKAESVFEKDHYFCVPLIDGQIPFSQEQLRQILRELAIGIYMHGTVPFFSLHFNQNAELFSVIHPAYQDTLVGRVIGMLDYFMKGYLNGGVFQEEFVDNQRPEPKEQKPLPMIERLYNWWWPPASSNQLVVAGQQPMSVLDWLYSWWWPSSSAQKALPLDKLIDFEEYCQMHLKGEDKNYASVRSMQQKVKISGLLEQLAITLNEEPEELTNFDGFKNSFRIIAKQNSFQKEDNLFVIDADFDVLYTIEPSPMYQEKLEEYFRKHGEMPASYQELIFIYELMSKQIHDHMVKMPMCREYFAMLGVINFFSSYFSTLKKHHKLPELAAFEKIDARGCPPVFPHLPLSTSAKAFLRMNLKEVISSCLKNNERLMHLGFSRLFDHLMDIRSLESFDRGETQILYNIFRKELESNILGLCNPPFRRYLLKNQQSLNPLFEQLTQPLLDGLFTSFEKTVDLYKNLHYMQRLPRIELVKLFLSETCQKMPNQIKNISKEIPYNGLFGADKFSTEQLEKNKRIVGGCGMQLKEQRVQSSSKASFILENNHLPLDPETWEKVSMGTSEGAVFRLGMEDIPHGIIGDYSWMESLLQEKIEPELMQSWVEIQQAMELEDHAEFKKYVKAATDLTKIKGSHKTSLLHMAAKNKDPYYVKYLLKKDLSTLTRDANGYLPVHYAAMMGCMDVLKLFIEDDDDDDSMLDAVSIHGASALITAIQHNQEAAVNYLLKNRTKAAVLTGGYTELHCALHEGNINIINAVLANRIACKCLNVCCEEGGTPLMLACELKSADFVKTLLAKGADATIARKDGVTAIEIAVRLKSVEVLKELLEKAKPSSRALRAAAERGTVEILDLLLKKTENIFSCNNEAQDNLLHIALRHANLPAALYLTEYPAFIHGENIERDTPLKIAILMGAWKVADALYDKGARVDLSVLLKVKYNFLVPKMFDAVPLTAGELQEYLNLALQEGNELAITEVLRPKGAKLELFQPVNGWEALHYLAKCDGVYLFKVTYAKDPLMPIQQEGNKTLAYIAAENSSYYIFHYLLEEMQKQGCSLEDHYQDRHLFYAVIEAGHMDFFEKMLEMFEDLKDVSLNKEGMRPVHLAAKMASEKILKALEEKEADLQVKDQHNHTALYYAICAKEEACIAFLLEKNIPIQAEDLYAATEDVKILEMLMQKKPDQAILDHTLYLAVRSHNKEAFLRLHVLGASFNHVTPKGWTPTLLASYYGQEDILEIILQSIPVDQREMKENNALHLACMQGHASCVKMLTKAGFSSKTPNRLGKTPQDLAKDQVLVLHALKNEKSSYPTLIEKFVQALKQKEGIEKIQQHMEQIPQGEKIFIDLEGKKIWGTPLQLLIRFSEHKWFISRLLNSLEIDPNFPDSEGNTLAHLLVLAGMNLLEINQLQLHLPNHQGETPLHLAASKGNIEMMEKLIEKLPKEELNAVDHKGRGPIFSAIENRQAEALRLLIEVGVDLNHWDNQLITPLLLACQQGSLAMVRMLNENGVNLNKAGTVKKLTALHFLIGKGQTEIARYLIMKGANPHILIDKGISALHLAAEMGNTELLYLLRAKGVSSNLRDKAGWQIKHRAAVHGNNAVLEAVSDLQKGLMDASLDTPLEFLEKQKDKSSLQNAFEDVFEGATPLHLAAYANQIETVDWLINQGANPEIKTVKGKDSLFFATLGASTASLVKQFTKYSFAQEPKSLFNALFQSIVQDNLEATKVLYHLGVPINAFLLNQSTGLHIACYYGALECTSWLLQQGADPLLENGNIQNAFQISAENSSFEQFKALLEYAPMDLDEIFQVGAEPLIHIAVLKGNIKHVMLLIAKGAALDNISSCGYTPFHRAIRANQIELAKLLLFCGANRYKRPRDEPLEEIIQHLPEKSIGLASQILEEFSALSSVKGESKLHRAVRGHYSLGVRVLAQIEDLDQYDSNDQTALDLAKQTNQKEVIRYLSSFFEPSVSVEGGNL
ncbi:ankyrin repeat domain-containing protein [Candidatus Rhabdochlamydia sp. T3358]|uniref:ankyrin repeat domain-containing protein n=1 Tax=Candidatus Rhabdochlamydia sp. T3358 TaxID=2099795 RepID=UPI0010BB985C|nr:ankyrin repeat domain-containing protein [Candidatus Rhabdochlamydia sp. T3358]VHO04423.1 Ankyrin repeats (3 copies) [Candidatus Rhabdochlamydia sp. T3358]